MLEISCYFYAALQKYVNKKIPIRDDVTLLAFFYAF
jgi:hypothetical protein